MSLVVAALLAFSAPDPTFTQADIDQTAHQILTDQQHEREHRWAQAVEANRQAQEKASRARAVVSSSATGTGSSTRTAPTSTSSSTVSGGVWDRLAECESGGNWAANTGNGYYGGVQFSAATWAQAGGTGLPHQHSRETQIAVASSWLAKTSWAQWPSCSRQLGLR